MASTILEMRDITKTFPGVKALSNVNLSVEEGEIHAIVGENGAGKSTLMSILYGFYQADKGEILVSGAPVNIKDPSTAIASGIGMVHQHFMLVENFTVLENVMLGAEDSPILNKGIAKARKELKRLEDEYEMEVDPDAVIEELPVGIQQRVEILKALFRGAEILILDEPTGVLTPAEADHLFRILRQLKEQGKTVILITHKLREIMAITDEVSVMRRGEMVATRETSKTSVEELAELMVGRRVLLRVEKGEPKPEGVKLSVRGLTVKDSRGVTMVDADGPGPFQWRAPRSSSPATSRANGNWGPPSRKPGTCVCTRSPAAGSASNRRQSAARPSAKPATLIASSDAMFGWAFERSFSS